jgi:hypothetical protein
MIDHQVNALLGDEQAIVSTRTDTMRDHPSARFD